MKKDSIKVFVNQSSTKEEFDELLEVSSSSYSISNNPNKKVGLYTRSILKYLIIIVLCEAWFLYKVIFLYPGKFDYILLGISSVVLLVIILLIVIAKSKIKFYMKNSSDTTITINSDYIELLDNNKMVKYKWSELKYIVAYKYSICFIPSFLPGMIASIPIGAKSELYKALQQMNKIDIFIDNSIFYL